jgi:putative phosphoribosyl transferase
MNNNQKLYFKNRLEASEKLIEVLPIEKMRLEDWIVVATSYGGYLIAQQIAKRLNAQYKIMFTEKITAPNNDECEIAIVTESEEVVIHEELVKAFDISLDFIFSRSKYVYDDLVMKKINKFRAGNIIQDLQDKNILLVDEGLNTSLTMMACIKTAINLGAKSVSVATPIIPDASVQVIESIADDLYYAHKLDHFIAIDYYYETLEDITFEEIKNIKDKG